MAQAIKRLTGLTWVLAVLLAGCSAGGGTIRAGDVTSAPESGNIPEAPAPDESPAVGVSPPTGSADMRPAPVRNPGAVALQAQAMDERSAGQFERSASTLERALRIAPDDAALWLELGEVRLAQGRPDLAETLAQRAASLAGGQPDTTRAAQALAERSRRRQ